MKRTRREYQANAARTPMQQTTAELRAFLTSSDISVGDLETICAYMEVARTNKH